MRESEGGSKTDVPTPPSYFFLPHTFTNVLVLLYFVDINTQI